MNNKIGIYKITNTKNNKIYIGSSNNIERRWKEHIYCLNNNKHHSKKFQRAWNKYGGENFKFEIIEYVESNNDLFSIEQEWINKTLYCKNGYNISEFAGEPPYYILLQNKNNKKQKEEFYINEINKLRINCFKEINFNELIKININIRHKEFSTTVFNKQSIIYNVLPIYYNIINKMIIPNLKNNILGYLNFLISLRQYNSIYHPSFELRCNFINNSNGISICTYYNIVKIMCEYNISLKNSIIKCLLENEYTKFVKIKIGE